MQPGTLILITPPQLHTHIESEFNAGLLPIITVGEPGTHGAEVTGMHGIGVSTPSAAAVAAATVGLLSVVHMPNGAMLSIGTWSMIVAAGLPPAIVNPVGSTASTDGAAPKLHCSEAPFVTCMPMDRQ